MSIKRFIAIWEVLQHFKSIFSTSLWMLIPGVNLFKSLAYTSDNLYSLPKEYYAKLYNNFEQGYENPLQGSREYFATWLSQSILSIGYIVMAFFVNHYCVQFLSERWPEYFVYASIPDWVAYVGYAFFLITVATVMYSIFNLLHSIYKAYTQCHPEYCKQPLPQHFLERQEKAIAARTALVAVPVRIQGAPEINRV